MTTVKQPRLALAFWWLSLHVPGRRLAYWLNHQANKRWVGRLRNYV